VAVIALFGTLVGHFWGDSAREPVALAVAFTATVTATLALCTGFGWLTWTQDQITAVLGVLTALLGVGTALFARSKGDATPTPKRTDPDAAKPA
jgi:FtsH-binding integral membrane protein